MLDSATSDSADDELMQAIAGGDEHALAALYDRYAGLVHAICLRILRSDSDAQAVTADVFWEVWRFADRYNPGRGSARNYLATLARSRAVDNLRSSAARNRHEAQASELSRQSAADAEIAADPSRAAISDEDRREVRRALTDLSEQQQRTLDLAYFGGLSHREIADELKMPLGSVKTYIRQGLIKLRQALARTTSCEVDR